MTNLQVNRRHGHKFIMSGAMFGFCMLRMVACALRISWATKPESVPLVIAASIFVAVGDIVGWVVNLNLAQRILRAVHPGVGWHPAVKVAFIIVYAIIVVSVGLLIGFTVDQYYTLDRIKHVHSRDVAWYGTTYFAFAATLPIPLVLAVLCAPRKTEIEPFGTGSFRAKNLIVLFGSCCLALGIWFRCATNFLTPRPVSHPAPYQSKACFYIFYFSLEILVIYTYLVVRIDKRFYIPDGSKGPGDYSKPFFKENEKGEEHTIEGGTPPSHEHVDDAEPKDEPEGTVVLNDETEKTVVPEQRV